MASYYGVDSVSGPVQLIVRRRLVGRCSQTTYIRTSLILASFNFGVGTSAQPMV